jgi:hypothetical protein
MPELDLTILSKLRQQTSKNTKRVSIVGQEFHRLTVYALAGYAKTASMMSYWLCRCTCGNFRIVAKGKLKNGSTKSCGCFINEIRGNNNRTHGMNKTPTHRRWSDMLTRATNPAYKQAKDYSERGITVCDGLRKFEGFFALLGEVPPRHEIDRKDNNGGYWCGSCEECLSKNWPMNVHWVSKTINTRNTRKNVFLTHENETHCIAEWAEITNQSPLLIAKRKRSGWPDDECLGFKERPSADRYRRNK